MIERYVIARRIQDVYVNADSESTCFFDKSTADEKLRRLAVDDIPQCILSGMNPPYKVYHFLIEECK
jgi:hypothetical protein